MLWLLLSLIFQAGTPQSGLITGRLTFSDGFPVSGVGIQAVSVAQPPQNYRGNVSEGAYRIQNLPPGNYYVGITTGAGWFYPGVNSANLATAVTVTAGAETANINFALPDSLSGVRVSGRVNYPPGQAPPANTRRVQLTQRAVPIGDDGSFDFPHVLPGGYALSVLGSVLQPSIIAVADKDIADIQINIPRMVPVSGTVAAEGGARPALSLLFDGTSYRTALAVQPNGTFSTQLPEGVYVVGVSSGPPPPGRGGTPVPLPAPYYVNSFAAESQNLVTGPLRITTADSAIRLALTLGRSAGVKVSGHVRADAADRLPTSSRKVLLLMLPTMEIVEAEVQEDGSFVVPKMNPGTYAATVTVTPEVRSAPSTVVIPNRDVTDLEIAVPAPQEVFGRIAVDGNGPPPKFSLTLVRGGNIAPAFDADGLPSLSRTDLAVLAVGGAHVLNVDVSALPDASFRMTLPQGDYRVIPSVGSPAYFIRSLTHGSERLLTEPLRISDKESAELHIGFGTKDGNPWRKVRGRVVGADSVKGPFRLALDGSVTASIETPVNPDGTFEFPSVLARGSYELRPIPSNDAVVLPRVVVDDKDIENLQIVVPREREVTIVASLEGNGPVPAFMMGFVASRQENGRTFTTSSIEVLVKPEPDGSFKTKVPEDERRVSISSLPLGYGVKSLMVGSTDLKKDKLTLAGTPATVIRAVFELDPSVPLGSLQGRVTGLDPEVRDVRLVLNGAAAFASFETVVNANGTFSFPKLPQGAYIPTLAGGVNSGLLSPSSIFVTGTDMTGVEINLPKGSARPNRPDAEPANTGAVVADVTGFGGSGRVEANESAAIANLRTLNTALVTYLSASAGNYGDLPALINAGLIDRSFTDVKAGFRFNIMTTGREYAAVAIPAGQGTARYGYFSTPDAVIRYSPLGALAPPRQNGQVVR